MIPRFRVWCVDKKEWERDTVVLTPDGSLLHLMRGGSFLKMHPESHIVSFSTGLKDRNGREIFEGDYYKTDEIIWEVYFGKNQFDGERSLGWCIKSNGKSYALDLSMKKGIIIGNIYQNPELMEAKP